MQHPSSRIAFGLIALVALWIGVYWWVPSSHAPKGISFSAPTATSKDAAGKGQVSAVPSTIAPKAITPPVAAQPPSPPPPTPAIIPPQFFEHTISQGETYATISMKFYGTSAYASAISKANPLMSPTSLRPGRVLRVPKDPKNIQGIPIVRKDTPAANPADHLSTDYIVEPGDSLSKIAARMYGDSKLASMIFEANKASLRNVDSLKVGQKLSLPPKPAPPKE